MRYAKLVFYKGVPIGHIWANVPFSMFYSHFSYYIRIIFLLAVGLIFFALFMSSYLGNLVSKATNNLAQELKGFAEISSEYSEIKPSEDYPVEFNPLLNHFNKMAKKISELFQELIIASRLTNLGTAISVVSHDIRNPLTCIKLSAELGKISHDPDKQKNYFRKIVVTTESINSIINKYLVLTKNPSDEFENISIDTLLINLITIIKKQIIQKGINFSYKIEENLPILWGNRVALSQALMNIIANAKDATPSGGEISIEVKSKNNRVLIVVTDTGVGIPEHLQEMVFEKFFTTKGNLGTGIGLALAKNIITNHGGRIGLKSSIGKGTSLYVWLPTKKG